MNGTIVRVASVVLFFSTRIVALNLLTTPASPRNKKPRESSSIEMNIEIDNRETPPSLLTHAHTRALNNEDDDEKKISFDRQYPL